MRPAPCRTPPGRSCARSPRRRPAMRGRAVGWSRSARGREHEGRIMHRRLLLAIAALPALLGAPDRAGAADIVLVSPGAMRSSLSELVARFEQSAGHKVTVKYSPALALAD